MINSVNTIIYHGIDSLEAGLVSIPPERLGFKKTKAGAVDQEDAENDESKHELEEGLHQFETLMAASIDKRFDIFEIYTLRNILSMPVELIKWIRLSHYHGIAYSPSDTVPTTESIEQLRRRLAASRYTSHALNTELNRNDALLTQLKAITGQGQSSTALPNVSFLGNNDLHQSFTGQKPLTTNVEFTLSQLPALKATVSELKDKLALLKSAHTSLTTANQERREERRQYIEQRTRAHLERNGQVGNNHGDQLTGNGISSGSVEAIEQAARLFNPP